MDILERTKIAIQKLGKGIPLPDFTTASPGIRRLQLFRPDSPVRPEILYKSFRHFAERNTPCFAAEITVTIYRPLLTLIVEITLIVIISKDISRMIDDDIENYPDAKFVRRLDKIFEFAP